MECPKCKRAQPDGLPECQYCGVIFARIPRDGEPPPVVVRRSESADDEFQDDKPPAALAAIAAFLAVLLAIAWWLNTPSASAPLAGAYKDADKGFAVLAPAEWLQINPANYRALMTQYKDRFPKHLQQFISSPNFAVAFMKIPQNEGELPPSLNVIAMPLKTPLPPLNESQKEVATKAITGEISKQLDSYRLLSSTLVKVDKQTSLQLTSTATIRLVITPRSAIMSEPTSWGTRHVVGYNDEVAQDIEFKTIQTLVPGRDHAFILSCTYSTGDIDISLTTCQSALDSFRVSKRPPRFGSVTMGALNGGITAACGYLLFLLIGRLTRRS